MITYDEAQKYLLLWEPETKTGMQRRPSRKYPNQTQSSVHVPEEEVKRCYYL